MNIKLLMLSKTSKRFTIKIRNIKNNSYNKIIFEFQFQGGNSDQINKQNKRNNIDSQLMKKKCLINLE